MQIGPVRHVIDAKLQAALRPFEHRLIVRETSLIVPEDSPSIQALYKAVAVDRGRGALIARDVELALAECCRARWMAGSRSGLMTGRQRAFGWMAARHVGVGVSRRG